MMVAFDNEGTIDETDLRDYDQWAFIPDAPVLGLFQNAFGDASSIYRRDALRKVGGFHEEYGVTHEDWELHLRASLAGLKHAYIPDPVFWYRASADSMIRTTDTYSNDQRQIKAWEDNLPRAYRLLPHFVFGMFKRAQLSDQNYHRAEPALTHEQVERSSAAQLKRISAMLNLRAR